MDPSTKDLKMPQRRQIQGIANEPEGWRECAFMNVKNGKKNTWFKISVLILQISAISAYIMGGYFKT